MQKCMYVFVYADMCAMSACVYAEVHMICMYVFVYADKNVRVNV